jgi:poly-gamma-glutamate capsule biosynthesis protein CapA/YwtB (metallophosphatase superfamily)
MGRSVRPATRPSLVVALVATIAIVAVALAMVGRSPNASPPGSALSAASSQSTGPITSPSPGVTQTATPSAPAVATSSTPPAGIAVVPIVGFWSTDRSLTTDRLRAALAGRDRRFRIVVVGGPDLAALAASLHVGASPTVRQLSPRAVIAAVQGRRDVLGFIRAADVRPSVRALGIDGRTLFGNGRVRTIAEWPLTVPGPSEPAPAGTAGFDPGTTWTLVAAGDVMLDREVYRRTVLLGGGPDFPWNGGTAKIVGRFCCSAGLTFVKAVRTGGTGAVAALFRNADLALVNHEGPAPDAFIYHPTGLTFTFDPRLEVGLWHAGIDVVSLANNHIRNAGSAGVIQTIRAVNGAGIAPVGAGRNIQAARQPAWFTVEGIRVAVLAYDAFDLAAAGATRSRPGAAPLDLRPCRADIAAARAAGADVVVVVPHWGVEYTSHPTTLQRRQAAALIAAGADIILGSHPHWAGAIEAIGQGLVVYSMGDFIFDLPRSEQTDEGLIVELTFVGRHLAQVEILPTIEIDRSQPNLLDPAGDGRVVLERVRDASKPFLDW